MVFRGINLVLDYSDTNYNAENWKKKENEGRLKERKRKKYYIFQSKMEDTIKPEMVIVKDVQEIKLEEDLAEADPLETGGDPNCGVINSSSFSLYDILRFLYAPGI